MMDLNELILSEYKIDDVVYYIMDCKIYPKEILGVSADKVKDFGKVEEHLRYKINITLGNGWVTPDKLFSSKIKAGEYLLAMNGLNVTLKEV